jgi:8-oxo-dGTP diphosphatase
VKASKTGAGLLLFRPEDGAVLLLSRSEEAGRGGTWGVPGGGVEADETPEEAALREAREELGGLPRIRLALLEPAWHAEGPFFAFATHFAELAAGEADRWEPRLNWESEAWGWFDPTKLPRPLMPGTARAVSYFLKEARKRRRA